eukprot:362305-Chlamydomonas_euryale.AAC.2
MEEVWGCGRKRSEEGEKGRWFKVREGKDRGEKLSIGDKWGKGGCEPHTHATFLSSSLLSLPSGYARMGPAHPHGAGAPARGRRARTGPACPHGAGAHAWGPLAPMGPARPHGAGAPTWGPHAHVPARCDFAFLAAPQHPPAGCSLKALTCSESSEMAAAVSLSASMLLSLPALPSSHTEVSTTEVAHVARAPVRLHDVRAAAGGHAVGECRRVGADHSVR